jgi:hypothetical protein
MRNSTA